MGVMRYHHDTCPRGHGAGLSLLLAFAAGSCSPAAEPAAVHSYTNTAVGYTIEYPDTLSLQEQHDRYTAIGHVHAGGFEPAVEIVVVTGDGETFHDFALQLARLACAADGTGMELDCRQVQRRQPFTTARGASGEIVYLEHILTRPGTGLPVAEDVRGPFFVFALEVDPRDDRYAAVVIRPPMSLRPDDAAVELVRTVAATFQPLDRRPR
jgi:hypothetical protein